MHTGTVLGAKRVRLVMFAVARYGRKRISAALNKELYDRTELNACVYFGVNPFSELYGEVHTVREY